MQQEAGRNRRLRAVQLADTINSMGGVPVSEDAIRLSERWAAGELTGEEMKAKLLARHRALAKAAEEHS